MGAARIRDIAAFALLLLIAIPAAAGLVVIVCGARVYATMRAVFSPKWRKIK